MTNGTAHSRLILHADDLGMNRAVNEGILRGFRHGLLTSASLLANAPDAVWGLEQWKVLTEQQAAGQLPSAGARRKLGDPDCPFDLGVHLNLTQGRPLTGGYPAELLDADGRFPGVLALFARLRRGDRFRAAIRTELERQVQVVCDHGLRPTHLNGHQYVEMMPAVSAIVPEVMERFGINMVRVAHEPALFRTTVLSGFRVWKWPMARVKRHFAGRFRATIDARAIAHPEAFYGTAHAGGVDLPLLRLFLTSGQSMSGGADIPVCPKRGVFSGRQECLPHSGEKSRLVEIALHPGERAEEAPPEQEADGWHDPLATSRPGELQMLVSAELAECLKFSGWSLGRLAST
jgi:chitin disaccharide deacetylase